MPPHLDHEAKGVRTGVELKKQLSSGMLSFEKRERTGAYSGKKGFNGANREAMLPTQGGCYKDVWSAVAIKVREGRNLGRGMAASNGSYPSNQPGEGGKKNRFPQNENKTILKKDDESTNVFDLT